MDQSCQASRATRGSVAGEPLLSTADEPVRRATNSLARYVECQDVAYCGALQLLWGTRPLGRLGSAGRL